MVVIVDKPSDQDTLYGLRTQNSRPKPFIVISMADELDFLELLIASERISRWVRVISSSQASQAAK